MTTLNETQTTAVCLAYCAMFDLQDAADRLGVKSCIIIDTDGNLFASPDTYACGVKMDDYPHFLRNVKDRTPKEIEDYKAGWIKALQAAKEAQKDARIKQLKAELAALTEIASE